MKMNKLSEYLNRDSSQKNTLVPMSMRLAGFSLVEVALAILVVAVGMLAVLALFPASLGQANIMENEMRACAFAEEVFADYSQKVLMENEWGTLEDAVFEPVLNTWADESDLTVERTGTDVFTNIYQRSIDGNLSQQYALRYSLEIDEPTGYSDVKYIRLVVWPKAYGVSGPTNEDKGITFYTEFYEFGN